MAAQTLNCPMCGASASSESTRCAHCGARLATVACPACFGMMFRGQKFCSHCGAKADRAAVTASSGLHCPRCGGGLDAVQVGGTELRECPKCDGLWAEAVSLEKLCMDREKQAAVLGMASDVSGAEAAVLEKSIRYVPCPVCAKLMNRVNFARCSQVVVDVCKAHGTWFDKDELRRVVEFIRAGGLEKARVRELSELEEQRRRASKAETGSRLFEKEEPYTDLRRDGISALAGALSLFLKH